MSAPLETPTPAPAPAAEPTASAAATPAPAASEAPAAAPAPLPSFFEEGFHVGPPSSQKEEPFDYQKVVEFDPFSKEARDAALAPPAPAPAAPTPPAAPAAPGAGQAPAGQAPKPAVPSAPAAAPDPRDLQIKLLTDQMAVLQNTLRSVSAAPQAQPGQNTGRQVQEPQASDVDVPAYNFTVPKEWMAGLNDESEEVRQRHLQTILTATARAIHTETVRSMRKEMATLLPQHVHQTLAQRDAHVQVEQDYYGKYAHHQQVRPLVGQVTQQVFAETGAQHWSPEIRDAIGNRVQAYLQAALVGMPNAGAAPTIPSMVPPGVQAPAAPGAPPATVPKAPHVFGGIASPGVAVVPSAVNPNSPDGIAATLTGW